MAVSISRLLLCVLDVSVRLLFKHLPYSIKPSLYLCFLHSSPILAEWKQLTQRVQTLVPNTMKGMVLGPETLIFGYLDPLGYSSACRAQVPGLRRTVSGRPLPAGCDLLELPVFHRAFS